LKYFYESAKNKTVINIAHKLKVIENCDKLLLLENGEIVEYGASSDLKSDPNSKFNLWLKS